MRNYQLRGRYQNTVVSGLITTIAAHTATAGHLFVWRWDDATVDNLRGFVRYVGARFVCTTAYGTAQETALRMTVARGYTASHSGGTAIDVGGTVTGTGKRYTDQPASLLTSCRMATTVELTAGTHTLDANPLSVLWGWTGAIGDQTPLAATGGNGALGTMWDSRDTEIREGGSVRGDHLMFDNDEGFVISNLILMGATGVGRLIVTVGWDEGVLNG